MKNIICILIVIVFFSCKNESKNHVLKTDKKSTNNISDLIKNNDIKEEISIVESTSYKPKRQDTESKFADKLGYYVGEFVMMSNDHKEGASYTNLINISIDAITNDSVFGHSIVAGNIRPFKGIFNPDNLYAEVKEPGDDKYDGIFKFKFKINNITGKWYANDKNLSVNARKYALQKMNFIYDPKNNIRFKEGYNEFILSKKHEYNQDSGKYETIDGNKIAVINASNKKLTNKAIENLNKGELEVLRNLIYARHGYSFKNRKMRYFFDSNIAWYIPISTDIRNELTSLEKQNIDLIKRYEQHAERYYDYFGR